MNVPFATPIYEGSVKSVYQDQQNPAIAYFAFSNRYSVFDWGEMPDHIEHKGQALSIMGGYFFEALSQSQSWQVLAQHPALKKLSPDFLHLVFSSATYQAFCQHGCSHHFLSWQSLHHTPWQLQPLQGHSEPVLLQVQKISIPQLSLFSVEDQPLYAYPTDTPLPRLIPLEVVFRFGMPHGSSLLHRLESNPDYIAQLGLSSVPPVNQWFERPVMEYFTKLEATDRHLSLQEALLVSGLSASQFKQLHETALLISLWLFAFFADRQIELWDGKFEFAWTTDGLILVDSIGPDELRLIKHDVHLSKEVLRQYYRSTPWYNDTLAAKAKTHGQNWQSCSSSPPHLPADLTHAVSLLYQSLTHVITETPVFGEIPSLEDVINQINAALHPQRGECIV